ncbi:MAG: DUF4430 domain-containing protein [Syntrophomonas sp.]|nr:DUF4430 domain-containing protein [Syntrophomonas sp.]
MKKIFYMGALGLLLLGLLGPFIYPTDNSPGNTQSGTGQTTTAPLPAEDSNTVVTKTVITPPPPTSDNKQKGSQAGSEIIGLTEGDRQDKSVVWAQIKVVGINGEVLLEPAKVQISKNQDTTVFDALAASGVPFEVSRRWPGMVESIAGLANKGQSGWMYQVNGETPLMAADKKTIASGDRIIWWYSQSVNSPPPK